MGEDGSKLETDRKSQPVGEKSLLGAEEIRKNRRGKVEASLRLGGKVSRLGKKRALGEKESEGARRKQACDWPEK